MAADVPRGFEAFAGEPVPQASVGAPGKAGELELVFAPDGDGRTRLVRDYARVPFHVSGTLDHDPHPDGETVCVQSPTGGVAQGDRHGIDVEARPGAVAHVTTQSSTKVQSMEHNYAAAEAMLRVGADAHLDYVPEPTILHADARYCRRTALELGEGATAVVSDVVVPGRLARGERLDFERYRSRLRVTGPDGLLFEDATDLGDDPEGVDAGAGVLGEFDVYGSLYVLALDAPAGELSDRAHERSAEGSARAAATTLPNGAGALVRALGDRADAVTGTLRAAWDGVRPTLAGAPAPPARAY